jgi:hypothetical protein
VIFPPKFEKKTLFEHALIKIVRFPERSFHSLPHCMLAFSVGWGKKVDMVSGGAQKVPVRSIFPPNLKKNTF